ncbi:transporter substrate-binding domain-containing protein [Virgibacillus soli]|uniref:transporter substrate-binding domain-containing protein n=1 Tax=Paracerasibacillus soli TaxID=480284 RepID=UPI0035EA40D6
MKKWGLFGLAIISLLILLAACGEKGAEKQDVLKMGTSADFPPFETRNEKGEFIGFDIELAEKIAEELGYKLEVQDMNFDGLVGALQAKRVDMVMAGMSADEKRKKNVDFSVEYNRSGEIFISHQDTVMQDLNDLKGKIVGVQLGTIQEEGADNLASEYGFEVKKVDDATILIQELNSNRIDVAYMDKEVGLGYVEAHDLNRMDDPTSSTPGMGIAFPKDSELVAKVNKVLEKLEENGELQKLKDKWLSESEE